MADECSSKNSDLQATKKWTCNYCTYLNWDASNKCVICRQPRNRSMFIEELSAIETESARTNEASSALSFGINAIEQPSTHISIKEQLHSDSDDSLLRWPCSDCTYLNCRRTKKCTLCGSNRPSQWGSDSSINESTKSQHNAGQLVSKELLNKWSCADCTFANWPSAFKCTICGKSRDTEKAEQQQQKYCTPSPKRSPNVSEQHCEDQQIEQMLDKVSIDESKHSEQHEQQKMEYTSAVDIYVRRYLGNDQTEKLFFTTIRAIGHRELQMVNKVVDYLINEGNLQRDLTTFEARLMNHHVSRSGNHRNVGFARSDSLLFLAKKSNCPDLLKLIRRIRDQDDRLPCGLNCLARTRLYTKVTQFMAVRDGPFAFKCQFISSPCNFSILKIPLPLTDEDLSLAVQTALFRAAPLIPPQYCFVDCFDSKANRADQIVGHPPNFLLRNRNGPLSLYDSVFQCMFGVCDRYDILRGALKYTMQRSANLFKVRWMELQLKMARDCGLTNLCKEEIESDWEELLNSIDADDECIEPIHVWALSHVVCRPIIVHSMDEPRDVDQLASIAETVQSADQCQQTAPEEKTRQMQSNPHIFEGIYLPVLWPAPPISRSPLLLCYRNGLFSAVIVSDDVYQRDFEVQRYLRLRRHLRRPINGSEPLFRFLTGAESGNSAFLSQFILFGECTSQHLSIRRESHQFLPESYAFYKGWINAMLQTRSEVGSPCTIASVSQLEARMDSQSKKQSRNNQSQRAVVSQLFSQTVQHHQHRQRQLNFVGRLQQQSSSGETDHVHSDGEQQ